MRHLKNNRKFGRNSSHRKALFRNMASSLLQYEKITTTLTKAKELRGIIDRTITLGKKGDLPSRRRALGYIRTKGVVHKLFSDLAERYKDRAGGYTRIYKLGNRAGDNAPMAQIELVDRDLSAAPKRRVRHLVAEEDQS